MEKTVEEIQENDALPENRDANSFADVETEDENNSDYSAMEEMFESSLSKWQEGELVQGEVIQISKDYIMIDVGYKSEGQLRAEEFRDEKGEITVKIGDIVDVVLERKENKDGLVVLSKNKADQLRIWNDISKTFDEDDVIDGVILARIKGGLAVDIGVKAFLPGSQVDIRPVKNLDELIGKKFTFKILKFNKKQRNIVLSRRALLEKEKGKMREETLEVLEEGQIIGGVVKNITDYGVFVDLGGIDGLVHITDLSWGRVKHPMDLCSTGDKIKVKVLKFDRENQRVSLGMKQITPDPWSDAQGKYAVGSRVKGEVVSLTDYGAFVRLEEGIEGLVHVSEMSWTQKIRHPSKVVSVGDFVDTVVLDIDSSRKRISLGMKQFEPNPWETVKEKYPVGTRVEGVIKNVMDFGIFVGIEEGIDGLVHISDISWRQKITNPSELYKKGQNIEAVVLNIDQENGRFSLGIKQLEADPWDMLSEKYQLGQKVTGQVTNITDFGLFVELEEGIEGLVHVSEMSKKKVENPTDFAQVGEKISAVIINIVNKERKIGLSIKVLDEKTEGEETQNILNNKKAATSNLGDLLKEELEQKTERES